MVHPSRISVVVPNLNQARWLGDALMSLIAQQDKDLEIIVMDGGSTDGSHAVIERFRRHLAVVEIGPDGGQSDALSRGFEYATGGILAWLNADDMHLPWTLASWRECFQRDHSRALYHGDRVVINADTRITGCRVLRCMPQMLLERVPWFAQETAAFRRTAYNAVGGIDRSLQFAMDYDLFVRLLRYGGARHIPRLLGAFRWHPDSKSATIQSTVGVNEMRAVRTRYGLPEWSRIHPGRVAASCCIRAASMIHTLLPHDPVRRPTRSGVDIRQLFHTLAPESQASM